MVFYKQVLDVQKLYATHLGVKITGPYCPLPTLTLLLLNYLLALRRAFKTIFRVFFIYDIFTKTVLEHRGQAKHKTRLDFFRQREKLKNK
jgi:hypothetical protein